MERPSNATAAIQGLRREAWRLHALIADSSATRIVLNQPVPGAPSKAIAACLQRVQDNVRALGRLRAFILTDYLYSDATPAIAVRRTGLCIELPLVRILEDHARCLNLAKRGREANAWQLLIEYQQEVLEQVDRWLLDLAECTPEHDGAIASGPSECAANRVSLAPGFDTPRVLYDLLAELVMLDPPAIRPDCDDLLQAPAVPHEQAATGEVLLAFLLGAWLFGHCN